MTKLEEIRSRWSVPPQAHPTVVAVAAMEDVAWLIEEVERLRTALGWYVGDGVVLNPGPQVAQEALKEQA